MKYRACRSIEELYLIVMGNLPRLSMSVGDIAYKLIDRVVHVRGKNSHVEYYVTVSKFCFDDLFEFFEIEINGEWLPFGVLDDEKE